MLRTGLRRAFLTAALLTLAVVQAGPAMADAVPPPPPASGGTTPVSASAGSPAQPGGTASLAMGRTSASDSTVAHCGVAAGAGSMGYAAQPAAAGTSGTSTPTDCSAAAPAGSGQPATSGGQAAAAHAGYGSPYGAAWGTAGQGAGTDSDLAPSTREDGIAAGGRALPDQSATGWGGNGGWLNTLLAWLGWLLALLLLVALLFILLVIPARRRKEQQEKPRMAG